METVILNLGWYRYDTLGKTGPAGMGGIPINGACSTNVPLFGAFEFGVIGISGAAVNR